MLDYGPFISGGIGFITAVLVGWLTGTWGNLRQIERLLVMIDKTSDPEARAILDRDLQQRLTRHDRRSPRGVKIGLLVFWALMALFVLTGMAISPPSSDTPLLPIFFENVDSAMQDQRLSRRAAVLTVITLYVMTELALILWAALAYFCARSLYRRTWWRWPREQPTPITRARLRTALAVSAQAMFVLGFVFAVSIVYLLDVGASPFR